METEVSYQEYAQRSVCSSAESVSGASQAWDAAFTSTMSLLPGSKGRSARGTASGRISAPLRSPIRLGIS